MKSRRTEQVVCQTAAGTDCNQQKNKHNNQHIHTHFNDHLPGIPGLMCSAQNNQSIKHIKQDF